MAYVFLIFAAGLFVAALRLSGALPKVRFALAESRQAWATMMAADLAEEDKETAVQRAAVRMFGSFLSILLRGVLCVALPLVFVAVGVMAGLYRMEDVMQAATNVYFIAVSTAVVAGGLFVAR